MKYEGVAVVILSVFLAAAASAQEEIGGAGTPNFIAGFTGRQYATPRRSVSFLRRGSVL
jgi:hypothetical protein